MTVSEGKLKMKGFFSGETLGIEPAWCRMQAFTTRLASVELHDICIFFLGDPGVGGPCWHSERLSWAAVGGPLLGS